MYNKYMNKFSPKIWFGIGAIVLLLLIVLLSGGKSQSPVAPGATENPASSVVAPSQTGGGNSGGTSPVSPRPVSQSARTVTSPLGGAQWVIGPLHTISWSKAAGEKGAIYLVDAVSKATVGVIDSETGPSQTSFSWDTQNLYANRYGGLVKKVTRGSYIVKIVFDRVQGTIESGVFSIIAPEEVKINTYQVSISGFAFSPSVTNVRKGDKITFTNNDQSLTYEIFFSTVGGLGPSMLAPGQSITFTLNLPAGTYPYVDKQHSGLGGKVVVSE